MRSHAHGQAHPCTPLKAKKKRILEKRERLGKRILPLAPSSWPINRPCMLEKIEVLKREIREILMKN